MTRSLSIAALTLAALGALLSPSAALAFDDGMPSQSSADLISNDLLSSGQAGWADMAGGVAARPYVERLSIINGTEETVVIADGEPGGSGMGVGGVGAVIQAYNLCRFDQLPEPGQCYSTPNRIGVTMSYSKGGSNGWNFSSIDNAATPWIDADSIIDLTIALNTLGSSLRWTWMNGDLAWWHPQDLGTPGATVRMRFKPAVRPWMDGSSFPEGNGCTATPIFNCALVQADGEGLGADLVLSLDDTLSPALTGAVFATQRAVFGYLDPMPSDTGPRIDLQVAAPHNGADSNPQQGTLKAFLPSAAILNFFGLLPADAASALKTSRTGDPGTNDPPAYTSWTVAANGSDGLFVSIGGISFSTPTYRVRSRLATISPRASVKSGRTRVTARMPLGRCTAHLRCTARVYRLGTTQTWLATRTLVGTGRASTRDVGVTIPRSSLNRGKRYLLVVRRASSGLLLASVRGTVS